MIFKFSGSMRLESGHRRIRFLTKFLKKLDSRASFLHFGSMKIALPQESLIENVKRGSVAQLKSEAYLDAIKRSPGLAVIC